MVEQLQQNQTHTQQAAPDVKNCHEKNYPVFDPETRANPQALYAIMRQEAPVYRTIGPVTGNTFWVLTRYEDCVMMLKDQRFGKEIRSNLPPEILARYPEPEGPLKAIDSHLLNLDPPNHTRLRALIHKAFTPAMVENLRPRIQQIANDLLDKIESRHEMDLITDYGFPLPITVIAELLGIPIADQDKFRAWTKTLLFSRDQMEVGTTALEFVMYMHNMIDQRRENPKDDLLSALVYAKEEGKGLDQQELLSMIFLLLVAGHETTVNLIGNGTRALLENPDQMELLRRDPSLIKSAVEEMLRYNGPVETTTFRWTFDDVAIGGKTIPKGDIVIAALLAANRDPEWFSNPDQFDITRQDNKHLAFGNGIHYCVGAPLARLEGAIAINTLLQRLPALHADTQDLSGAEWNASILLHGMNSLRVKF